LRLVVDAPVPRAFLPVGFGRFLLSVRPNADCLLYSFLCRLLRLTISRDLVASSVFFFCDVFLLPPLFLELPTSPHPPPPAGLFVRIGHLHEGLIERSRTFEKGFKPCCFFIYPLWYFFTDDQLVRFSPISRLRTVLSFSQCFAIWLQCCVPHPA